MKLSVIWLAFTLAALPPTGAEMQQNITYAKRGDRELKLDFLSPGGTMRPLVICIHGGGWARGNKRDFHFQMRQLLEWGYASASISYRLTDVATWPAQFEDAQAALEFLTSRADEYGIDPERVVVLGGSAGGHLSLLLGSVPEEKGDTRRVRGVVNYFGPADLGPGRVEHARDLVEKLLGGKLEDTVATAREASPLTYIDRGDAPVLTFHGTADTLVPFKEQAVPLHAALDEASVPNTLNPLEGVGHGIGPDIGAVMAKLRVFLDAYLKGADLPLLLADDFGVNASRWEPTDGKAWAHVAGDGRSLFSLTKSVSDYQPAVRSPHNIALLKKTEVGDFVFDIDLRSTQDRYDHQSLCMFFGHQDPSHFYYVHFGRKADSHANSIFLVNGEPRVSVAKERNEGTDWSEGWHRARIVRRVESGEIEVYFDNMQTPVMKTIDKTFGAGRIGFGSFDDKGDFDTVRLYGVAAEG